MLRGKLSNRPFFSDILALAFCVADAFVASPTLSNNLPRDRTTTCALNQSSLMEFDKVTPNRNRRGLKPVGQRVDLNDPTAMKQGNDFLVASGFQHACPVVKIKPIENQKRTLSNIEIHCENKIIVIKLTFNVRNIH